MKSNHLLNSGAIGLFGLFTAGCLTHTYTFSVLPDRQIEAKYELKGDLVDFQDDRQQLPELMEWHLRDTLEQREDETIRTIEGWVTATNSGELERKLVWDRIPKDSLLLRRNFSIRPRQTPWGVEWRFEGRLKNRRFNELYGDIWTHIPTECRILEDEARKDSLGPVETEALEKKFALGVIQWNQERYLRLFDRAWSLIKVHVLTLKDTSATAYSIARAGWAEDLHQYMNRMEIVDPNMANLDWWADLKPLFIGHFTDIIGLDSVGYVIELGDALEREYQITKDIEDDRFVIRIKMPGIIIKKEGADSEEGMLKWEFDGKLLQNEDGVINASTLDLSYPRIILALLLFGAAVYLIFRRRRVASS